MDRKLRLVPTAAAAPGADDEAPISEAERAEAEALRAALDRGDDPLAGDLRAAFAPAALADDDLDAILARAMGDEDASTRAERAAADRLREELGGSAKIQEAALLVQLRLANDPKEIDPARNEALIEAAIRRSAKVTPIGRRAAVRRLSPVTIASITGVAALAAAFALVFVPAKRAAAPAAAAAALIPARSTDDLFDAATPFPRSGEESARIDRIAAARGSDLRANRFAAWGVR